MNATPRETFLVMTHNAGNGHARLPKLAQVIRDSGADIVGLQEITAAQAEGIDVQLAEEYPHRVLYGEGIPGKGFLSRFPIIESRRLYLFPDRPDLWGRFDLGGRTLDIVNGHPWPPRAHRNGYYQGPATRDHILRLLSLAATGEPTLVLGDFNLVDRSRTYAQFEAAGLTDAFREAGKGRGGTLPVHVGGFPLAPVLRVDYILHTSDLSTNEAWVGEATGSDHRPVLARLSWASSTDADTDQTPAPIAGQVSR